ncbi:MAG TPA: glucose 1-dehydrogenase [Longimicrobiales bacterium]|nr:glucose 1-dehydrogenase [Longimicrobiales bacterium]
MKAIAITPGVPSARLTDLPEPNLSLPDEIKVRILQVGICGTDRDQASGGRPEPPEGANELVIGHEMLGEVVEVGAEVTVVQPGDLAVFTVRRGCSRCMPCAMGRPDMCLTGDFRERGIHRLHGFQSEHVVDREQHVVRVPEEIEGTGVLAEPLSVIEKAIDEAVRIQITRLPAAGATPNWLYGRSCLVAGLGPVGLLAAMVLTLRGARVYGLDIVDRDSARPQWLEHIGGVYIDGRDIPSSDLRSRLGPMNILFEASGAPRLAFDLIDVLAPNGVYVLTGIPEGHCVAELAACDVVREMVRRNQVLVGSVNAALGHFQMAIHDLIQARYRWGAQVERLITHRLSPDEAAPALLQHPPDEIKAVVTWARRHPDST